MGDYSRGYAAGLKAAAGLCQKVASRHLAMSDYQAATALECKGEILSEPIVGEATNPGEQECVMVPVEPTEKILNAIAKQINDCMMPKMIYQAMLAAAAKEEHEEKARKV